MDETWQEIESSRELARWIARSLEVTQDITLRWIVYQVAELMKAADDDTLPQSDRRESAERCGQLVLSLWTARATWPEGWPTAEVKSLVNSLSTPNSFMVSHHKPGGSLNPWDHAAQAARGRIAEGLALWEMVVLDNYGRNSAAADDIAALPLEHDERAVFEEVDVAARRATEALDRRINSRRRRLRTGTNAVSGELDDNEKVAEVLALLRESAEHQVRIIDELEAAVASTK